MKRQAEIIERIEPSYGSPDPFSGKVPFYPGFAVVQDDQGDQHRLLDGSPNGTEAPVGAKGTLEFIRSGAWSLWFFTLDS